MADEHDAVQATLSLVDRIKPLLANKGAAVQGAVLADLLAIWLAGHIVIDDPAETLKVRAELLSAHLTAVREMVRIEDAQREQTNG